MAKMGGLWQEWGGSRSGVKPFRAGHWGSAPHSDCLGHLGVLTLPGPQLRCPRERPRLPAPRVAPSLDTTHLCEEVILQ